MNKWRMIYIFPWIYNYGMLHFCIINKYFPFVLHDRNPSFCRHINCDVVVTCGPLSPLLFPLVLFVAFSFNGTGVLLYGRFSGRMSLLPWRMRTPLTRTLPPRVGAHCSISTTAISWRPGPSLLTKTATSSHIYPGKTGARHQTVINNYLIKIAKSSFMIMQYNLITNSQSTVEFYFWIYVKCFSLLLNFYLPVINLCKTAWVKQISHNDAYFV